MALRPLPLHPALAPWVEALLVEEEEGGGGPYTVLPGLSPVMGFQWRGRLAVLREAVPEALAPAGITGLLSGPRSFQGEGARSVLAVFRPFGAHALLGCPMHELADGHVALGDLMPLGELEACLAEAPGPLAAAAEVQAFLLRLAAGRPAGVHPGVRAAVARLSEPSEPGSLEEVARDLGLSRRHLERRFREEVGVPPREFASLARFRWALARMAERRSWADLAQAAGYADQAHFVRSFRRRTGRTPTEF